MKKGFLSEYFTGVGVKRLSKVDADPKVSNQHEIGTTKEMRRFLGETHQERFVTRYIWLGAEEDGLTLEASATHYDARKDKPDRSAEWRLYYTTNPVTAMMREGDTLFLAKRPNGELLFIAVSENADYQSQLLWLFGFDDQPKFKFTAIEYEQGNDAELGFAARFLLDTLGIEFTDPNADEIDSIIERFGLQFPKTLEFSNLARATVPDANACGDPDHALMAWLSHEEAMFRRLERRIVSDRIEKGFAAGDAVDVDGFLSFSLSVQNRRKSRMGQSFENHLAALFDASSLTYKRGGITERGNKPDFLFPSLEAYHDPAFPENRLTMLAAKSVCKERWRQILPEADRIRAKHLVTLEPAISAAQTEQMQAHAVQLVVPKGLQASYSAEQQEWLWDMRGFITHVSG